MKKNLKHCLALLLASVLLVLTFSGCGCKHEWAEATCTEPKTCTKCGETEGDALGHTWQDATCTEPKTCTVCGETEGDPVEHSWQEATETTPKTCTVCGLMEPLPMPENGQIFLGKGSPCFSELAVQNIESSCYVTLLDTDKNPVYSFFVRPNEYASVKVPNGLHYVRFSFGEDWYGTEELFGEDTTYYADPEAEDFSGYTWTYDLTKLQ